MIVAIAGVGRGRGWEQSIGLVSENDKNKSLKKVVPKFQRQMGGKNRKLCDWRMGRDVGIQLRLK